MNHPFAQIWPHMLQAHHTIARSLPQSAKDEFAAWAAQMNTEPRHIFHFVYVVENFDPYDLSAIAYQKRDPFDHINMVQKNLDRWQSLGWIEPASPATYRITSKGLTIRMHRWQIADRYMQQVERRFQIQWTKLLDLLAQIFLTLSTTTAPPPNHNFMTRLLHGIKAPVYISQPMQLIEYRMDLGAYRDDAHLAAWRNIAPNLSPQAWELLTMLWNGTASSLDTVAEKLAHRGFTKADYTLALQELGERGWAETAVSATILLTQTGQTIRDKAESTTDELFYKPWQLTKHEIAFLTSQLEKLK